MNTKKIFDYLKCFKNLPTYQFERRVDAFILPYLEIHFNKHFNEKYKNFQEDFIFLYPEFPIERNSQSRNSDPAKKQEKLSDYVDYIMWSECLNTIYLVEFKTEINSLTKSQFETYLEACQRGWFLLINYYFKKSINNSNWRKFAYGLNYMHEKVPSILGLNDPLKFQEFTQKKRGTGVNLYLEKLKGEIKIQKEPEVKFIYLAPAESEKKLKSFAGSIENSEIFYEGLIALSDFGESTDADLKNLLQSICVDKLGDQFKLDENNQNMAI